MKRIIWAACAAMTVAAGTASHGLELRLGMSAPEPTPWAAAAKAMAARTAELSGGELTISPYFSNELGDGQTMARQLARGRLDMAALSNVEASLLLPEFGLLNAPFLFADRAQADCVMDRHLGNTFDDGFRRAGAVYLAPIEIGSMEIFAKRPFLSPADMVNQKIRTSPAPADTYYVEATGAAAVPLGVPDTMPALKTGAVVGITSPVIMGVAGGYVAEAPEIVLTDHSHQIGALLISNKAWKRLSDDQKAALSEGAKAMGDLRQQVRAVERALLEKATAEGARIHRLSPAQRAQWQAAAVAAQTKILSNIGGDAVQVWARLQDASATCAP